MGIITEKYTKDRRLSPHFALHEFRCKSGAETLKWCEETVALLEKIFDTCLNVKKITIPSPYRTPEYSVKVGGTKDDGHTVGIAVDVKCYDNQNHIIPPKYIACIAQEIGFTGIGVMKNSIHLDTRTTKNYKNGKWWGDETNGNNNIKDFFAYFGLTREEVYKFLGVVAEQKTEEKVEQKKEEVKKPVEVIPELPTVEAAPEPTPEVIPEPEAVEVEKEPEIETPKITVVITEQTPEEEEKDVPQKENILSKIIRLVIEFLKRFLKEI